MWQFYWEKIIVRLFFVIFCLSVGIFLNYRVVAISSCFATSSILLKIDTLQKLKSFLNHWGPKNRPVKILIFVRKFNCEILSFSRSKRGGATPFWFVFVHLVSTQEIVFVSYLYLNNNPPPPYFGGKGDNCLLPLSHSFGMQKRKNNFIWIAYKRGSEQLDGYRT